MRSLTCGPARSRRSRSRPAMDSISFGWNAASKAASCLSRSVQQRIAEYLRERSTRIATAQYLAVLASRAAVEGVELPMPSELGAMQ